MSYDVPVLLDQVAKNMRVLPRGLANRRKLVNRKHKSKFYWYDFTVRGHRYRGSTQETKAARASRIAGLKLAQAIECTDRLPKTPTSLGEFSRDFFSWLQDARLENQTKRYYRNGWRLLKSTAVAECRLDQITNDSAERLNFSASSANANCALRTLRRTLHKGEEWKRISVLRRSSL